MNGRPARYSAARAISGTLVFAALLLLVPGSRPAAAVHRKQPVQPIHPILNIPLKPLGFTSPPRFYLLSKLTFTALDFIDRDHLLLSFHTRQLILRAPQGRTSDQGQVIRAIVFDLNSGRPAATAEWRMYDHGAYLWPLSSGHFLLRKGDDLFGGDASLQLQPLASGDGKIVFVRLSPDRKVLLVEREGAARSADSPNGLTNSSGASQSATGGKLAILDVNTGKTMATAEVSKPVDIPILADGFFETSADQDPQYSDVRFIPLHGAARIVRRIQSACPPVEEPLSGDTLLVIACSANIGEHIAEAINMQGKLLWQQLWPGNHLWPMFAASESGTRFASSYLDVRDASKQQADLAPADIESEPVTVQDTASGQPLLTVSASPLLGSEQNYALSPDGDRLAVLHDRNLQIFDLPR
jgi:hypothetical protein